MEYSLLSQINPARHNWRIKVRVARMWQVSGTSNKGKKFASMELVLVDEEVCLMTCLFCILNVAVLVIFVPVAVLQGQGIMASVGQKDLNKFSKFIVEGHCYYIKNFHVSRQ